MAELPENAGRGVKWLALGLMILFFGGLMVPVARYAWDHRPMDDKTLFESRCIGCHRLPSLERTRDWHWDGVVANMRYLNGANNVINDEEAERITEYLVKQHEERWKQQGEKQ